MASNGLSRLTRPHLSALVLLVVFLAPAAQAQPASTVHISATTLDRALIDLSRQTGVDIVSTEPGLARIRTKALDGKLSAARALDRLLAGTGYRARRLAGGFRIMMGRPAARPAAAPRPAPAPLPGDIVVTASKQRIDLLRYPGSVEAINFSGTDHGAAAPPRTDKIAELTPVLERTALGPGRNKLFIRGIADSSFNGATESTASVYLGDVQLGYSGAEPDLRLVDIAQVEVLEGPQGTLYGAGSIGGIVRITPNPVDMTAVHARATVGGSVTLAGAPSIDGDAMVNLPIVRDTLAVRAVGYRSRDGGFIDDRARGINDINRTDMTGARAEVRATPGNGWEIGAGIVWQRIDTPDSGYAAMGAPPLSRWSQVSQPFASDLFQGHAVITKRWPNGLELVSATGYTDFRSTEQFDASGPATGPNFVYFNHLDSQLITQETRLSRSTAGHSWVVGIALLHNEDAQDRAYGPLAAPTDIVGVTNIANSASLFGEVTFPVWSKLSITAGLRGTVGRNEATPTVRERGSPFFGGQTTRRVDPTFALSYRPNTHLTLYARAQTGYRTGGLAVTRGAGRTAEFQPDSIVMGETGFRWRHEGDHPLSLGGAVAYARWDNIQADLFSRRGQPFTTNLGDAEILSVEFNAHWEPVAGLRGDAALLFADNSVSGPIADTSVNGNRRLAQVPPFAANGSIGYQWTITRGDRLELEATGQYVGRALLGTGDFLDIPHAPYAVLGARFGWSRGRVATALSAENLLNSHANQFSLGNPLTLGARDQMTPLRPLTVRLGISIGY